MGSRKVQFKPNAAIEKCPKCSNNSEFVMKSQQVCEDGCEIWATCKCGYDPTEHSSQHRMEDVMGSLTDENCVSALDCTWNEMIQSAKHQP